MKEFEVIVSTIAWIATALLAALLIGRIGYAWHTRRDRRSIADIGWSARIHHLVAAFGLVGLGYGLVVYLFVLQRGSAFVPIALKLTLAGLLLVWLFLEIALHFWLRPAAGKLAVARAIVGILVCWGLASVLIAAFASASRYPDVDDGVLLEVPFEGEWVAIGAGATSRTNHHSRIPSQRYAVDFAKTCDDGRMFRGDGTALDESCTWDAAVLAPAAGTVVHTVDGLADAGSREQLAGNHVIMQVAEGRYVALAHLRQGSIRVAAGDAVRVGQPIGNAGNSGNSDFPHLHLHVQDGPVYDLQNTRSIPFRFAGAQVKRYVFWRDVDRVALLSNDRIRGRRVASGSHQDTPLSLTSFTASSLNSRVNVLFAICRLRFHHHTQTGCL